MHLCVRGWLRVKYSQVMADETQRRTRVIISIIMMLSINFTYRFFIIHCHYPIEATIDKSSKANK